MIASVGGGDDRRGLSPALAHGRTQLTGVGWHRGLHRSFFRCPFVPGLCDWLMGNPIGEQEFLQRAIKRFGDHYDYSLMVYKSYKTPIRLKCGRHPVKDIMITPERHLQTTGGCKFCLREMRVRTLERELARPAVGGSSSLPLPNPVKELPITGAC